MGRFFTYCKDHNMTVDVNQRVSFASRHNSPTQPEIEKMLKVIGYQSLDDLINDTIPASIRSKKPLDLPEPLNEYQFLNQFKELASRNQVMKSLIGMGYYNCVVPPWLISQPSRGISNTWMPLTGCGRT